MAAAAEADRGEVRHAKERAQASHLHHRVRRDHQAGFLGGLAEWVTAETCGVEAIPGGRLLRFSYLRQASQVHALEQRAIERHQAVIEDAVRVR